MGCARSEGPCPRTRAPQTVDGQDNNRRNTYVFHPQGYLPSYTLGRRDRSPFAPRIPECPLFLSRLLNDCNWTWQICRSNIRLNASTFGHSASSSSGRNDATRFKNRRVQSRKSSIQESIAEALEIDAGINT